MSGCKLSLTFHFRKCRENIKRPGFLQNDRILHIAFVWVSLFSFSSRKSIYQVRDNDQLEFSEKSSAMNVICK